MEAIWRQTGEVSPCYDPGNSSGCLPLASLPLSLVVKNYYTEVLDGGSRASGEELWLVKAANFVSSPGTSQGVWV